MKVQSTLIKLKTIWQVKIKQQKGLGGNIYIYKQLLSIHIYNTILLFPITSNVQTWTDIHIRQVALKILGTKVMFQLKLCNNVFHTMIDFGIIYLLLSLIDAS